MEKELDMTYASLQNGSDVRGIAISTDNGTANLTEERVGYIACAFAELVAERVHKDIKDIKIAIGHDSRLSARTLTEAAMDAMTYLGADVMDCGLASTPSMFMATVLPEIACDGAVMMTASHLPYDRNGMKFFLKEGGLDKEDIRGLLEEAMTLAATDMLLSSKSIEKMGENEGFLAGQKTDVVNRVHCMGRPVDLVGAYSAHLQKIIQKEVGTDTLPLAGLKIVVDASNGSGGFFATQVLAPLGADITGSICLDPDGTFPNHVPNPENKEAMAAIRTAVLKNNADLGIIFDTDGDRAAAVFADGEEINRNRFIALMAALIAPDAPGSYVVTDSVTSDELTAFLEGNLGLKHHRFKRGYRNVIKEAIRLNAEGKKCLLAMETSGHGALSENYFLDDGAYMSVKMICAMARLKKEGREIRDLIKDLEEPEDAKEYRIGIIGEDFKPYGEMVLTEFLEFCSWQDNFRVVPDNYEGIRVSFHDEEVDGWLLLRMSLHDPILPLNIEAKKKGGVAIIKGRIETFFDQFERLQATALIDR